MQYIKINQINYLKYLNIYLKLLMEGPQKFETLRKEFVFMYDINISKLYSTFLIQKYAF